MSEAVKVNADTQAELSDRLDRMNRIANEMRKRTDQATTSIKMIDEIAFERNLLALNLIDEIAFQTNLLASNATTKAARAVEASRSFTTVAEEVCSLARRSAEAAENTATMMEESAKNGIDITGTVTKVLEEIMQSFGKTTGLVADIATTLQEQAKCSEQASMSLPKQNI